MAMAAGAAAGKGSFWASNAGQAVASTGMSMAAGAGAGLLSGWTSGKQQKRAHKYNLEYMEKQFQQSKEAAAINQQYAKDMYDYTSYENERKHMEAAGLNPALMYGMGGAAGGSASGGGQASGGSQPSTNPVSAGGQYGQMSMQAMAIMSEIAKNNAQANKDNADAEKKRGVDTENVKADTAYKQRLTALQDTVEKVLDSEWQINGATYFKIQKETDLLWQKTRQEVVAADVAEKTKDEMINQSILTTWNMTQDLINKVKQGALTDQQIEKLKNDMAVAWANVAIGEKSVTNEADRIANELFGIMGNLDIREKEFIKDCIFGGVHAAKEISGEIMNWIMRGAPKTFESVKQVIEKKFNGKGTPTGTREVIETVTGGK